MTTARPIFRVDRAKSYANSLIFCCTPINPLYGTDILHAWGAAIGSGNSFAQQTGWNPSWINHRGNWILGHKMSTSNSTSVCFFPGSLPDLINTSNGAYTGDYTLLVLGDLPSTAAYSRVLAQGNAGQSQPGVLIIGNYSIQTSSVTAGVINMVTASTTISGTLGTWVDSTAGALDGKAHCFMFRRSNGLCNIYRDGVDVTGARSGSNSQAIGGLGSGGTNGLCIGGLPNSSENAGPNCTVALAAAWNRGLSDAEMATLSADPQRMFISPVSRYYIPLQLVSAPPPIIDTAVGNADGVADVSGFSISTGNADGVASVLGVPVLPADTGIGNADGSADVNGVALFDTGVGFADGLASAAGMAVTGVASSGGAAMMTA
jgi:hypothetical protein